MKSNHEIIDYSLSATEFTPVSKEELKIFDIYPTNIPDQDFCDLITEAMRQVISFVTISKKTPSEAKIQDRLALIKKLISEIIRIEELLINALSGIDINTRKKIENHIIEHEKTTCNHSEDHLQKINKKNLIDDIKIQLQNNRMSSAINIDEHRKTFFCENKNHTIHDKLAYLGHITSDILAKCDTPKGGRPSNPALHNIMPYMAWLYKHLTNEEPICSHNPYSNDDQQYQGDFYKFLLDFNRLLVARDESLSLGTNNTIGKAATSAQNALSIAKEKMSER